MDFAAAGNCRREAAWYIVCGVLCAYTHYFGLLLVLLQGVALAALAFDRLRQAAILYVPVVLAYLPWLPGMLNRFGDGDPGLVHPVPEAVVVRPEPDQQMISMLQRNFQPVHYECFDGAAVVTYKVGRHPSAGPPQPEPPSSLPNQE